MKEKLLAGLGMVGSILYIVLGFLLTGFFTFLPLYVIGIPWWLTTALVIIAVASKRAQNHISGLVLLLQFAAWVWSFVIIVRGPMNALAIV